MSRWIEERCPRCRYNLVSTQYPGYGYCPACRQYFPAHAPQAGSRWRGFWMPEMCKYCGQTLMDTSDPRVNYCPSCGKYQTDRLGY